MYALEVENLRKTYKGGVEAIKGIDLRVEEGEFYALLGPNGAGKSTCIGIVSSLVNKTSGRVKIFEHDLAEATTLAKSCIGLVPQEFNFNVWETPFNIVVNQAGFYGIPRKLAKQRAEKYLNQLGLWEKRNQQSRGLSGGMKRRLMIARALVHEPRLLILDEPTAGVDIEIRRSMWRFMREANAAGTTIILTTHYLEEAESLCRKLAVINHGEIIEQGDVKELLSKMQLETFVLTVKDSGVEPELPGFRVHSYRNGLLEVEVDKEHGLNQLFAELARQGREVLSIRNKTNRLEEFFLHLVEDNRTAGAA